MSRCSTCRSLLKATSFLVAVLAFFIAVANPILNHLIAPEVNNVTFADSSTPFDSSKTHVINYPYLNFVKKGHTTELKMGLSYIMMQSFPRWFTHLLEMYNPAQVSKESIETRVVNITDARKSKKKLDFERTGFTLIDMKDAPSLQKKNSQRNWRVQSNVKDFQNDLKAKLLNLYPNATRVEFTHSVVRGGRQFGDQPAAVNGPHLDYTQNDVARHDFHVKWPVNDIAGKEQNLLLGKENTDEEEMIALLGIWKPIMDDVPICDHPLAVMDARTFRPQHETLYPIQINFGVFNFRNLNGGIIHDDAQDWYYYSFQKDAEVLVFTQYSKGKHFCNPHTSFVNTNCPLNSTSRVSLEMRAAIFVKV